MDWFFRAPQDWIIPAILIVLAGVLLVLGIRRIRYGLARPDAPDQSLWVVQGFRRGILALSLIAFAGGLYTHTTWPLVLGAVFLGEEALETGIMVVALRSEKRKR